MGHGLGGDLDRAELVGDIGRVPCGRTDRLLEDEAVGVIEVEVLPGVPQFVECQELFVETQIDDGLSIAEVEQAPVALAAVHVVMEPEDEVWQFEAVRHVPSDRLKGTGPGGGGATFDRDCRLEAHARGGRRVADAAVVVHGNTFCTVDASGSGFLAALRDEPERDHRGQGDQRRGRAVPQTATAGASLWRMLWSTCGALRGLSAAWPARRGLGWVGAVGGSACVHPRTAPQRAHGEHVGDSREDRGGLDREPSASPGEVFGLA